MFSSIDENQNVKQQKFNLFDEHENSLMKHEQLAKLGFEERAVVMSDTRSVSSKSSASIADYSDINKPKAIEYLS